MQGLLRTSHSGSPEDLTCREGPLRVSYAGSPEELTRALEYHLILFLFMEFFSFFPLYCFHLQCIFHSVIWKNNVLFFLKDSLIYKQMTGSRVRKTGDWAHFCKI